MTPDVWIVFYCLQSVIRTWAVDFNRPGLKFYLYPALVSSLVKWNLTGMVERMRRDQVIYSMKPGT